MQDHGLCCTGVGHSKSQRVSELQKNFKRYNKFVEWVDLAYWWSCIEKVLHAAAGFLTDPV